MGMKRRGSGVIASGLCVLLGACSGMGDNSNPTLSIADAHLGGDAAELTVIVVNPSDHDLTLTGMDYELVVGPLPVASGSWEGTRALPADGSANFEMRIAYDSPPLDTGDVVLSGVMHFDDASSGGNMAIREAGFSAGAGTD